MAKTKQVRKKEIKDKTKNVKTTETVEAAETLSEGKNLDNALKDVITIIADDFEGQFKEEAEKLMKQHDVDEIWRCPVTGYWFTKKENAVENAGKVKKEAEHYKL